MSISIAEELAKKSMAYIDRDVRYLLKPVVEGFLRFVKEPVEYKKLWTFDYHENDDPDDGWIKRAGGGHDFKQHVHYRPRLQGLLRERGVDFKRHREWLEGCSALYAEVRRIGEEVTRQVDELYPARNFWEQHRKS
ncbi:hypothetical protein L0Y69_00720, partial [bacterium]|nr:hypothetical protein [bacterium]